MRARCGLAALVALLPGVAAGAQDAAREAAAPAQVSAAGNAAAFTERSQRPPAAADEHRRELGGIAINARNNGPWPAPDVEGITVVRLDAAEASEFQILAPFDTTLVAEIDSGIPRPLTSASLNAAWGEPCRWLADSSGMLCRFVMSARGSPPEDPEALVDYYFTSQLGTVQLATGRRSDLGGPDLFVHAEPVPGSGHLLVVRVGHAPGADAAAGRLQRSVEILDTDGNLVRRLTDSPARGGGPP